MFLDLPELSGKQVGLLKEIVPRLSHLAIFGISGLNAAQFAAAAATAQAVGVEAEIIEVQVPDDWGCALETAKTRQVEAGILLSSPLVFVSSKQSASLRWLIGSLSFPCSPNFQKRAVSWLMGRT